MEARGNPNGATKQECWFRRIAADKAYSNTEPMVWAEERGIRPYIAEAEDKHNRWWGNKPTGWPGAC